MVYEYVKKRIRICMYSVLILFGYIYFLIFKRTPEISYHLFISLFCITSGKSNDLFAKIIQFFSKKIKLSDADGVLGDLSQKRGRELLQKLNNDGFLVFENVLSRDECLKLQEYGLSEHASIRRMDEDGADRKQVKSVFDPNAIQATRYDFDPPEILQIREVQDLLSDNSILYIAREYLGVTPKADVLSMWWHTNFKNRPDSIAAQYFHFDMDRIKWLKFFIYITDVGPENGPHSFVKGSHKTGKIPKSILKKGYARISDEEIKSIYGKEDVIQFTGKMGTLIIEDTRGLHKGSHVTGGARLILQLQYSNSLFGTNYGIKKISSKKIISRSFKELNNKHPEIFRQYIEP